MVSADGAPELDDEARLQMVLTSAMNEDAEALGEIYRLFRPRVFGRAGWRRRLPSFEVRGISSGLRKAADPKAGSDTRFHPGADTLGLPLANVPSSPHQSEWSHR